MLDYILVQGTASTKKVSLALAAYRKHSAGIRCWEGDWGALITIGEGQAGYEPLETATHVALVLGAPVHRDDAATGSHASMMARLSEHAARDPESLPDHLVGAFQLIRIDKHSGEAQVITDRAAFIPAYAAFPPGGDVQFTGSHADAVARAAGLEEQIDPVSIADFLSYQTVTTPHTFYRGVEQLPPASIFGVSGKGTANARTYWQPEENRQFERIEEAGDALRETLVANLNGMTGDSKKAGFLMSGGEDSRVILGAAPRAVERSAVTVADSMNREARIARRVSRRLGAEWQFVQRPITHYLDNAADSVRLSESHNFFYHAHFNGFEHHIPDDRFWIGGLMADALCKGGHIKTEAKGRRRRIRKDQWEYIGTARRFNLTDSLAAAVAERRQAHNRWMQGLRPDSWAEWHSLYPASMSTACTNVIVNRRLFPNREPLVDGRILEIVARVPQEWKLDRRLFHATVKPLLHSTWFIPHAKGTFPYFGHGLNGPLSTWLNIWNRGKAKIARKAGLRLRNQGSWPIWKEVTGTEAFARLKGQTGDENDQWLATLVGRECAGAVRESLESRDPIQALAGLQIRLWAEELRRKPDDQSPPSQRTSGRRALSGNQS